MKKIVGSSVVLSSVLASSMFMTPFAHAEGEQFDLNNLYVGAGLGFNSMATGARGLQGFVGYKFNFVINDDISSAIETGYMVSGDFEGTDDDVKGLWVTMVESVPVSSKTDVLARVGVDFGDDDGLMLGTGVQYKFNTKAAFRMEYVARTNVTSLQANVLFSF